ncbi:hypothetical protein RFF05_17760 [Bengtsoniella intestinalis]|uniref:hypothetical protein n=1 Tax=Bengtsoniella intestinalis TaxID=3073143 RepID=UPI00391F702E
MVKTTAIHITPTSVRIAHGGFDRRGTLRVEKMVELSQCQEWFENGKLLHLQALVDEVADTLRREKLHHKPLVICYEGSGMETEFLERPPKQKRQEMQSLLKMDVSQWKERKKAPEKKKAEILHTSLRKSHDWGNFITEDSSGLLGSITTADYDLVSALVRAFAEHGFTVQSVESTATALLYCKQAITAHYDALHQLLFYINQEQTEVEIYSFAKNIPWKVEHRRLMPNQGVADQLATLYQGQSNLGGRPSPTLLLGGDGIEDTMVQQLQEAGISAQSVHADGRFTACVALLWKRLERDGENLVLDKMRTSSVRNLRRLAQTLTLCASVVLVTTLALGGYTAWNGANTEKTLVDTNALAVTLTQSEHLKTTANDQITLLSHQDSRIPALLEHIAQNTPENIHIISIDTGNAFAQPEVTADAEGEEEPITFTSSVQEIIYIRGFATDSHLPVQLYENCTNTDLGTFTLLGTKEVILPDESSLYAFELALLTGGAK